MCLKDCVGIARYHILSQAANEEFVLHFIIDPPRPLFSAKQRPIPSVPSRQRKFSPEDS
jgi:hypothetical protein